MELKEVELKKVDDVMFKRVGVDVPMLSGTEGFSSDELPVRALAVSNRFGYCLFAHPRGFSVARTADLVEIAETQKDKRNAGQTAQEKSIVTVTGTNIRFLSLSNDELTVAVCSGGSIKFHDLPTLVQKSDTSPFEVRQIDPHEDTHAKDFSWSPSDSDAFFIVTSKGKLLLGRVGSAPEIKVEKNALAASWSEDGQHIAYVCDNRQLSITTSTFGRTFNRELPAHLSDEDVDSDMTVDAIRWVRPDSIIVGYVRVNSEGEEDGYPLFIVNSTLGSLAKEESQSFGLVFYQLFPSIESFVTPSGSGPYMLLDYLKPWEMVVAACRKSIDDHIVLVGWIQENGRDEAYSLELGNDLWIPRIELQGNGDDNAIVGLAIDRTTTQIQLTDPKDDAGEEKLAPCPVLICASLEGKLSLFSFARLDEKWHVPDIVSAPSEIPESKRSTTQGSQVSGKNGIAAKAADDLEPQRAEDEKEEEKSSQSAALPIRNKVDAKDSTVSLVERFTRPSLSTSPSGPLPKLEGPKLGLTSGSHDSKQVMSSPGPSLASKDYKDKGPDNVTNTYEGMIRAFEDGSKSISLSLNSTVPPGFSSADSMRASPFGKTSLFPNQVITVPSSALSASSQMAGVFQKANDKVSGAQPASPQAHRPPQLAAANPSFSFNSTLPAKPGASTSASGAPPFPTKVFDMPTTFSQDMKGPQGAATSGQRNTPTQRNERGGPASQSWIGRDQQAQQGRAAGLSDMEAAFISELEKVRRMAEEVDQLMSSIEGRAMKDSNEHQSGLTRQSLEELEQGIHLLSEDCKAYRKKLIQEKQNVEDTRDESLRVDAWRIYARSLMEQKDDSRHQELWTLQKLHPELDVKRKRVLKADQDLKLKIAELEKHLHNLELKQWQTDCARRRPNKQARGPGQFMSVQNLYNTVNAQMAVAEELSLSLEKQLEALNINWSSPAKSSKKSTAEAILRSVAAHPENGMSSFMDSNGQSPISKQRLSYSPAPRRSPSVDRSSSVERARTHMAQVHEPCGVAQETTRRRRDSMDATWVESGAPKTTIKRPVHNKPSQVFGPGSSSVPTFGQRKGNIPEIPAKESWPQSRNARQPQSTRMGAQYTHPTFSPPGFEAAVPAPVVTGRMGFSTYGPQWPISQTDHQKRSSPTSPSEEFVVPPAAQFGYMSSTGNADPKESLFKWANTTISLAKDTPVAATYLSAQFAKPGTFGGYDGSRSGTIIKSGMVPATNQLTSGHSDGSAGNNGGNYASVPATKPRLLGAFDGGGIDVFGESGSDVTGKSGMFSKAGSADGNRCGSNSSTGNQMDGQRLEKEINQTQNGGLVAGSELRLPGPNSVPLLPGPTPVPLLTGPAPTLLLTGPAPTGGASASNIKSVPSTEKRNDLVQQSVGRTDRENQSFGNLKQPQLGGFTMKAQPAPPGTVQTTQILGSSVQAKEATKQRDEIRAASSTQNAPTAATGSSRKSLFDLSSDSKPSGPGTSPSPVLGSASSVLNQKTSSSASAQSQVSKSLFPIASSTTPETAAPSVMQSGTSSPTGNRSALSSSAPPIGAATTPLLTSLPSSDVRSSTLSTGASITSTIGLPVSRFGAPDSTTSASNVFSTLSGNTGLLSGNSGASAMAQSVSIPGGATAPSLGMSPLTTASIVSAPLQTAGSPFTSPSITMTNQSAPSPFSASASAPSQTTASPFASSSISGFSTAGTQMTSSPFGQSSMWSTSAQQPFMFPGTSSMASSASISPSPIDNNEEDMEEEASTGGGTGLGGFGGFGGLGLGSSNTPSQAPKTNPFGGSTTFGGSQSPSLSPPSGGQLFRPAAFSLPAAQSQSSPQQTGSSPFGSGFGSSGFSQTNLFTESGKGFGSPSLPTPGGFGQPAQLGPGQQALGSALGAFGQTRQVGLGSFGNSMGATPGAGFSASPQGGGFASAAQGGGFASAATGGGFASAATGGGFAGAATGGGFGNASTGGGFAGLGAGGGFGGSSGGGFQAFGGNQGGQPGFGSGIPPAQASLFTQMRK